MTTCPDRRAPRPEGLRFFTAGSHGVPFIVGLSLLSILAGCDRNASEPAPATPPTVVELAPVRFSDTAIPVRLTGVLSRKAEADLAFKIGGIVEEVAVRAGDRVGAGQILARLRLDEIDAQLLQAQTALAKAERDLARIEKLQANAVATLENLQDARSAVDVAAAQLRIAEFNRRYAVIAAPADGQVLRRLVEPNELVNPGATILGFAGDGEGWIIRAGVADADLARIEIGDRADVNLPDSPGDVVRARVTHIAGGTDSSTRTTLIELSLESPPPAARSGRVVSAIVQPKPVARRPVVAARALIEGETDAASVFVVHPGQEIARRVQVRVDAIDSGDAFLKTPLDPAVQVVVKGGEYLREGSAITVTPR